MTSTLTTHSSGPTTPRTSAGQHPGHHHGRDDDARRATPSGTLDVTGPLGERYREILTPGALDFLTALHDRFLAARHGLLMDRQQRRQDVADGVARRASSSRPWWWPGC